MFELFYTNQFRKDVKLLSRRGFDLELLKEIIRALERSGTVPLAYRPHKLSGSMQGFWEAHIKADWLIIWRVGLSEAEIWLTRTGTHADLFK